MKKKAYTDIYVYIIIYCYYYHYAFCVFFIFLFFVFYFLFFIFCFFVCLCVYYPYYFLLAILQKKKKKKHFALKTAFKILVMKYLLANAVIVFELCVSLVIILFFQYTEIDWKAYMQEVKGFIDGEFNYTKLKGDTGPLVYPGGFVWFYSAFYFITKGGKDIVMTRWIYTGIYLMFFALVTRLYIRCRVKGYFLIQLLFLRRIRSLFMLRFFNDCWTMLLMYFSITTLATGYRWMLGCLLYSISVSVKMNTFFFAPGLLFILLKVLPFSRVILCLFVCFIWQVLIALPFFMHYPREYLMKAFEFGRVFNYRWTVNFKFVSEDIFLSKEFSFILMLITIICWILVCHLRWSKRIFTCVHDDSLRIEEINKNNNKNNNDNNKQVIIVSEEIMYRNIVLTLMESNLIGVIFARSLHYQFLVWFFYSLPLVLSMTKLPFLLQVGAIVAVQYGFEVYPSTTQSSIILQCGFVLTLISILFLGKDDNMR